MAALTQVRETTRFLEAGSRSGKLAAGAAQVMPDGITRETIRRQPYAPAMASAHGSVLVDVDGDERTDLLLSHTALIHGHGYSRMAQAVAPQSRQLEAMPFPDEHETALARLLAACVPVDDLLVRFTSSGSEAVMLALRLATAAHGRGVRALLPRRVRARQPGRRPATGLPAVPVQRAGPAAAPLLEPWPPDRRRAGRHSRRTSVAGLPVVGRLRRAHVGAGMLAMAAPGGSRLPGSRHGR